ncbi:MAG: substrate-binding periplasmic protein [Paraglaciecola sp.]
MILKYYLAAIIFAFMNVNNCLAIDKVISIGVANFPPYSIVKDGKISGVEVDIVHESLSKMGYKVKFLSYPYGRLPFAFSSQKVDGTIVTLKNFPKLDVYYSEIVLPEYQTIAVHLKQNKLQISAIKDLKDKSILAHQRASLFYGEEYRIISEANQKHSKYQETARQESQISMLFKDRVDVIVLAHEIFAYYKARSDYKDTAQEFVVAKIFGPKFGFHNVFWDREVRDAFDKGLVEIKENGTYNKILEKYLKYFEPVIQLNTEHNLPSS